MNATTPNPNPTPNLESRTEAIRAAIESLIAACGCDQSGPVFFHKGGDRSGPFPFRRLGFFRELSDALEAAQHSDGDVFLNLARELAFNSLPVHDLTKTEYRFRPEFSNDAMRFFLAMSRPGSCICPRFEYSGDGEPWDYEPVCTFSSTMTLDELIALADSLDDCHVIAETIAKTPDYTGERKRREEDR